MSVLPQLFLSLAFSCLVTRTLSCAFVRSHHSLTEFRVSAVLVRTLLSWSRWRRVGGVSGWGVCAWSINSPAILISVHLCICSRVESAPTHPLWPDNHFSFTHNNPYVVTCWLQLLPLRMEWGGSNCTNAQMMIGTKIRLYSQQRPPSMSHPPPDLQLNLKSSLPNPVIIIIIIIVPPAAAAAATGAALPPDQFRSSFTTTSL